MVYPLQHIDAFEVSSLELSKFDFHAYLNNPGLFIRLYPIFMSLPISTALSISKVFDAYILYANTSSSKKIIAFSHSKEELSIYGELNFPCAVLSECCA